LSTGFITDEAFLRHHNPEGHPERVERLEAMLRVASGCNAFGVQALSATRRATDQELLRAHSREHLDRIAASAGRSLMFDPDTFTSPDSYACARLAAGGALDAVDRVMSGELDNAFVAGRPPGHHAETDRAMGFCLFNNIAVAGAHALAQHQLERVMIIDWDVHHGNGTQEIFWNEKRVLFVSLHQFPFYPGTGSFEEMGGPDAMGMTVNIPMVAGFGDEEWVSAFRRVVVPLGDQFKPELVLLSAGFDAHADDPLGGQRVTESGFALMADAVLAIARNQAGGKLVALLEGGYNIAALEASVERVLRRMSGETTPIRMPQSDGRFAAVHGMVRAVHAGMWQL
jgi:acetoin utilization deacetylase AcuC-like enzyme